MALEDRSIFGEAHADKPNMSNNNAATRLRCSRRGDLGVYPVGKGVYGLCDEGSYFVATNPTPGTGIAGIAASDGNNDLENLICVYNAATAAAGTRIYLDYLQLLVTAAGTNGTTTEWVSKIDDSDRYTSGGSAITEVNCNMDSTESTSARLHFGALVSPAASNQRLVGHGTLRSVIAVVEDTYTFDFGAGVSGMTSSLQTTGTAVAHIYVPHAPVILGPGDSWLFQINAASQTAASSFEFQLGFWER